jgi:hypothetical protein
VCVCVVTTSSRRTVIVYAVYVMCVVYVVYTVMCTERCRAVGDGVRWWVLGGIGWYSSRQEEESPLIPLIVSAAPPRPTCPTCPSPPSAYETAPPAPPAPPHQVLPPSTLSSKQWRHSSRTSVFHRPTTLAWAVVDTRGAAEAWPQTTTTAQFLPRGPHRMRFK